MNTSAFGKESAASAIFPKRGTINSSVPKNNFVFPFEVPGETRAAMEGSSLKINILTFHDHSKKTPRCPKLTSCKCNQSLTYFGPDPSSSYKIWLDCFLKKDVQGLLYMIN